MVKRAMPIIIVVLLGGGFLVHHLTRPDAERRIRQRIELLGEAVSKPVNESNSMTALKMQRLGSILADTIVVDSPRAVLAGTFSAEEFVSHAFRGRNSFDLFQFTLHDVQVQLTSDHEALIICTARAVAGSQGETREETAELTCLMSAEDGKWRFTRFEEVPVLER